MRRVRLGDGVDGGGCGGGVLEDVVRGNDVWVEKSLGRGGGSREQDGASRLALGATGVDEAASYGDTCGFCRKRRAARVLS